MRTEILTRLQAVVDDQYRIFHQKLVPDNIKVLGVRIPILHKLAQAIIKQKQTAEFMAQNLEEFEYQEEFLLYGLVLAKIKEEDSQKILRIKKFIPYINNWAVCDIFCSALKVVKQNPALYYQTFVSYVTHQSEYEIRFFYVLALNYFIMEEYLQKTFSLIQNQKYSGYYDKMAVAWYISITYIKYPQITEHFLFEQNMDEFVFRKSISKICDSYRIKKETKTRLRGLVSQKATI